MKCGSSETAPRSTCASTSAAIPSESRGATSNVLISRLAIVRNVPEYARWIAQIEHSNSPRLHLRGPTHDSRILLGKLLAPVLPPGIRVVDSETHHEVPGVLGDVKRLQQESKRANLQFRDLGIAPVDRE